jgi:ATPase subunit of ABC transporter with duplicated ATPase domains
VPAPKSIKTTPNSFCLLLKTLSAQAKDDKTIPKFTIEFPNLIGPIVQINSLSLMSPLTHDVVHVPFSLTVKKNQRYILKGPNGIGKSTLLKRCLCNITSRTTKTINWCWSNATKVDFGDSCGICRTENSPDVVGTSDIVER